MEGDMASYEVHVFTGARLGASTRADVKLVLCGDKGRTHEIYLPDSTTHKVKFQKGQVTSTNNLVIVAYIIHSDTQKFFIYTIPRIS